MVFVRFKLNLFANLLEKYELSTPYICMLCDIDLRESYGPHNFELPELSVKEILQTLP